MALLNCWYCVRTTLRPADPEGLRKWDWVSMAFWHRSYPAVTQAYFCSLDHAERWVQDEMAGGLALAILSSDEDKNAPSSRGGGSSGFANTNVAVSSGVVHGHAFSSSDRNFTGDTAGICTSCGAESNGIAMQTTYQAVHAIWKFCNSDCLLAYNPISHVPEAIETAARASEALAKADASRRKNRWSNSP